MRLTYYRKNENDEAECMSIRNAKKLLKKEGGQAWAEHYERDGTLFEVTEINLENNSNTTYGAKYNNHL